MADSNPKLAGDAPLSTRRAFYILWAVFWALMIVVAVQDQLHAGNTQWWEPLLWEGSSGAAATVWILLQQRVDRRYRPYLHEPVKWFAHHLKWMPLIAVTFIVSVYSFRHGVYRLLGAEYEHESWTFVAIYESVKLALYAGLWLGILFGFSSFEQWRRERRQFAELQRSLAEAQLAQLKAQLRPHFLFNALNTISALMHVDAERADRLLARLSELLRASLQSGEQERISLQEELRLLELYAQVMQERFADRVSLEWRIDAGARDAHVPALLLQPLLENALKHGVEKSREPVHIEISANRLRMPQRAAAVGARCELSRLHPAPDGDRDRRLLRRATALGAVDQILGRARRHDGGLLRAPRAADPPLRVEPRDLRDEGHAHARAHSRFARGVSCLSAASALSASDLVS